MKKRFDLRRLTPPGLSAKLESSWAAALLVPILLWHAVYWIALLHARNDLFLTVDGKAELIPNAVMPDFCELVRGAYNGFAILFLFLICLAFYRLLFPWKPQRLLDEATASKRRTVLSLHGAARASVAREPCTDGNPFPWRLRPLSNGYAQRVHDRRAVAKILDSSMEVNDVND